MALGNAQTSAAQSNQSSVLPRGNVLKGIVYDIVLDENSKLIKGTDKANQASTYIGAIKFRVMGDNTTSDDKLDFAFPSYGMRSYPIKNEIVEIIKNDGGAYTYSRNGTDISPNLNSTENTITKVFSPKEKNSPNSTSFRKIAAHGIARSSLGSGADYDGYGSYFEAQTGIQKLKLYEGDTLLESRFGQSLRFSAYNNTNNEYSPTIILRNDQNPQNRVSQNSLTTTTEEDINRDGSIIVLGSNEYTLPFQPGTVNTAGTSDFETKPTSFKEYPSTLDGNQILLNSGRVIISSKDAEMIFYSKKNYGFISDGYLSIDNKFGIDINVGDDINILTNDRDINMNTGNGKVNIGDTDLESLVRGETLVDLLSELIDAISQQVYLTPAGPTSPGPTNVATFNSIKTKLNTMLSKLNKTS